MLITVVAQNPPDYTAWAAKAVADADRFNDPAVAKGKQLFTTLACAGCHTIQGLTGGKVGPDLTREAAKKTPIAGVAGLDVNEANLKKWIANPPAVKPGTLMPNLGLDQPTIDSLVQFILTLK
jgi:cytochrome c oxidase subunit 2